ncbi:MAG TPA: SPOR domain-containing protein [Gammaproteobacteria bacterium]|nr:SPOR domain-containing protein [Gammaproteobacteria bacterium]
MQQRLKQRLIGAVVLVALGVIFIPMLLQGPVEREATSIPLEIPPPPAVKVNVQPAASKPDKPESSSATAVANPFTPSTPIAPVAESQAARPPPPAAAPVAVGEPLAMQPQTPPALAAWAVQVGSFGTEANALGLRDSLRAKGYRAYTEAIKSEGKTFYRVRVGPMVERAEAEKLKTALASKESLQGLVVPHP